MKLLRVLGILVLVAGIASILFSNYIMDQVLQGKGQIAEGEQKIKKGQQLFSNSPYTAPLGNVVTSSGQKKIAKGKEEIAYYENLAQNLKTGGIIGCVLGIGIFAVSFAGKRKRR